MAEAWWDGLAEGVILVRDGRVVGLNAAAARMLGTDPERAAGLPAIAVLRDHRLERVLERGGREEMTLRARRVEVEAIEGGLALRDVSEARRAQENARELLAVLSHELRTPVTTIRSTLEALGYDDLDEGYRARLLQRAGDEAARLVRLLEDLTVDVAPPRERSVALRPLLERARGLLAERFAEHRVRLRVDVPDLAVWADPDKVLQVFLNLLENAAVHGPDDATVELSAEAADEGVLLRVRDRGAPLPPELRASLFEPHARGPTPRARGAGLGLYIVRSIAERAGGRAWSGPWCDAEGRVQGNEFGVALPARRGPRAATDDDPPVVAAPPDPSLSGA
jgi:signal transduction histidine kinase